MIHVFPVKIASTESVGALKELIKDKKKHAFERVDADTLNVWKVSFPVDDDLRATLKRFQLEHDPGNGVHLSVPVKRLKGVFGDPIDEHLHVSLRLLVSVNYCGLSRHFLTVASIQP